MIILKEKDGKFNLPRGWMWRQKGEVVRSGDMIASYNLDRWERATADWWGKKVDTLDLVIRRIR